MLPLLVVMLAMAFPLVGCRNKVGHFTALSTKQIPLNAYRLGPEEESSNQLTLLMLPLGGEPELDETVTDALEERDGDVLLGPRFITTTFGIPPILVFERREVEGVVATTKPDMPRYPD